MCASTYIKRKRAAEGREEEQNKHYIIKHIKKVVKIEKLLGERNAKVEMLLENKKYHTNRADELINKFENSRKIRPAEPKPIGVDHSGLYKRHRSCQPQKPRINLCLQCRKMKEMPRGALLCHSCQAQRDEYEYAQSELDEEEEQQLNGGCGGDNEFNEFFEEEANLADAEEENRVEYEDGNDEECGEFEIQTDEEYAEYEEESEAEANYTPRLRTNNPLRTTFKKNRNCVPCTEL